MAEVDEHKKPKVVANAQSDSHEEQDNDVPAKHKSMRLTKTTKKQLSGFMVFVREQGVVGLAVGLTIGTAVTVFVKSIVDGIVNPIIGSLLPGNTNLANKFICLDEVNGVCTNKLNWGLVVSNFISFMAIAFIVYFSVKLLKLDKIDKKKDAPAPAPAPKK